jgi:hypothetical protein
LVKASAAIYSENIIVIIFGFHKRRGTFLTSWVTCQLLEKKSAPRNW